MGIKVNPLQRNMESLLKLLGGTAEDRLHFWEIVKGITTPAVARLLEGQIDAAATQAQALQKTLGALKTNAKSLSKG
jgi:hypothetical protein